MEKSNNKRVALIGAGPCGMALMYAFYEAKQNGEDIPEIVSFEKQSEVSGLWNLTWRTGINEFGEAVHGSMYQFLWSNGPKECLEMANYTFREHFKKNIPSFPPRIVLQDYLLGRFNKCKGANTIHFNTIVRNVREEDNNFILTYENLKNGDRTLDRFDYVIVATGHFSTPHMPYFPGVESFNGQILHSHDFRNANEFRGKTIVFIGSSYSAEDISLQCVKYGAKKCIISHRTSPMGFKWPDNIIEVPILEKIEDKTFYFKDGSQHEADAIICCTGYKHHFPFMENNLRLKNAANIVYPNHLYKGVILETHPKVFYIGMQDQYYTFTMFDTQAYFIRDVIQGKITVPALNERLEKTKAWYERCISLKNAAGEINFQRDYLKDLLENTHYGTKENVDQIAAMFHEWKKHKHEDIKTYRDKCFPSPYTGEIAIPLGKDWFQCLDDSKECFMNGCKD